jgi:hypothetical protein
MAQKNQPMEYFGGKRGVLTAPTTEKHTATTAFSSH